MIRPCPNPYCHEGVVAPMRNARLPARARPCEVCGGASTVDERDEDLREAGIVVVDATDEDFRSSPTHWPG
ncbi:MAG: hypothetical protein R3F59_04965 [Myxococcota bacterium]